MVLVAEKGRGDGGDEAMQAGSDETSETRGACAWYQCNPMAVRLVFAIAFLAFGAAFVATTRHRSLNQLVVWGGLGCILAAAVAFIVRDMMGREVELTVAWNEVQQVQLTSSIVMVAFTHKVWPRSVPRKARAADGDSSQAAGFGSTSGEGWITSRTFPSRGRLTTVPNQRVRADLDNFAPGHDLRSPGAGWTQRTMISRYSETRPRRGPVEQTVGISRAFDRGRAPPVSCASRASTQRTSHFASFQTASLYVSFPDAPLVVQYIASESTAMPHGIGTPAAITVGAPPALGILFTVPIPSLS